MTSSIGRQCQGFISTFPFPTGLTDTLIWILGAVDIVHLLLTLGASTVGVTALTTFGLRALQVGAGVSTLV